MTKCWEQDPKITLNVPRTFIFIKHSLTHCSYDLSSRLLYVHLKKLVNKHFSKQTDMNNIGKTDVACVSVDVVDVVLSTCIHALVVSDIFFMTIHNVFSEKMPHWPMCSTVTTSVLRQPCYLDSCFSI